MEEEDNNNFRGKRLPNDERASIPAGKRTEQWFEEIEGKVDDNEQRSQKNENYLVRIDYRTVWIIRLLVAVMATVIGGIILQIAI